MANRRLEGESKVSEQVINGAKYVSQFFEKAPNRSFAVERILGQGSWGFTLQMAMKSNGTPESSSSSTASQAPGLRPLPSLPDMPSSRSLNPTGLPPGLPGLNPASQPSGRLGGLGSSRGGTGNTKRFVLKRSLAEVGEKNITKEIDALDRLRGSIHIAQPSHVLDTPAWDQVTRSLKGPTLLMDWIENGLLWKFYERRSELDEPLPNRLLWSLFLCLCRMIVALAWPPRDLGRKAGREPELEVLPPRNARGERPPKSRLLHGDFHGQNIMIDKLESKEHRLVPMLKLIDFGMARDLPERANEPEDTVSKTNIRAIGEVMLGLLRGNIRGGPSMMSVMHKGQGKTINSYATDLDGLSSKYRAPAAVVSKHQDRMYNLDQDIRSLVALCVAVRVEDRPDIEDLLGAVEANARNKKPTDYRNYKYANNETDAAIQRIVQDYMFNA
ncbi:hypothetical protein O1611_g980 [Lasiodiplodia mahajangana]|uniref:Uncharacterized protein n=1 Tax=Lasiodiplodia mahajangana TaxID=1108764 RepID=A0ACC2JYY9_9PEZI|nr:hypothetical protein O1611_g980 [Lasiodiplodia mahajangana]